MTVHPRTKTIYNTGKHTKVLQVETPAGVVKVNTAVLQCVVVSDRTTRCKLFVCYMSLEFSKFNSLTSLTFVGFLSTTLLPSKTTKQSVTCDKLLHV